MKIKSKTLCNRNSMNSMIKEKTSNFNRALIIAQIGLDSGLFANKV